MQPLTWTEREAETAIGAMKYVACERNSLVLQPIQRDFLESIRDYIFRQEAIEIDAVKPISPMEFAANVSDAAHRARALEYLTVVPYIPAALSETQADIVAEYFHSAGQTSDTLTFLRRLAHHHILAAQLCIARKLLPRLLPGGPFRQLTRAIHMIRESRGDPVTAAPFLALEHLPAGTLGSAYFRFHRNRGFALPGEPGCIPEDLSALHDITHILSGYNTDVAGEIQAQAFAGGSMPEYALMTAMTGLLSYHNGLVFDAGGRFRLTRGALQPRAFWHAFARGMRSVCLVQGWDYKRDWPTPVAELRRRFRIHDAVDVWDDPPADQAVHAASTQAASTRAASTPVAP